MRDVKPQGVLLCREFKGLGDKAICEYVSYKKGNGQKRTTISDLHNYFFEKKLLKQKQKKTFISDFNFGGIHLLLILHLYFKQNDYRKAK